MFKFTPRILQYSSSEFTHLDCSSRLLIQRNSHVNVLILPLRDGCGTLLASRDRLASGSPHPNGYNGELSRFIPTHTTSPSIKLIHTIICACCKRSVYMLATTPCMFKHVILLNFKKCPLFTGNKPLNTSKKHVKKTFG